MDESIEFQNLRAISCSVRGKKVYSVSIPEDWREDAENRKEPASKYQFDQSVFSLFDQYLSHGRHCVLTFKFKDGTRSRARGNGSILLSPKKPEELSAYARKIITNDKYHPMRKQLGLRVGRPGPAVKKVVPKMETEASAD